MSLKDHCRCEHAKESHFEKQYGCLTAHCDCRKYVVYTDAYEEDPTPTERCMPAADAVFDPYDGWGDPADTLPMIPIPGFGDP